MSFSLRHFGPALVLAGLAGLGYAGFGPRPQDGLFVPGLAALAAGVVRLAGERWRAVRNRNSCAGGSLEHRNGGSDETRVPGRGAGGNSVEIWLGGAAASLVLLLVSGLWRRPSFHLAHVAGPAVTIVALATGALVARWLLVAPDRRAPWLLVVAQVTLVAAFLDFTGGAIPTRDDHPSFLYRFHLLGEIFPRWLSYNPEWNAGYLAYENVATGAAAPWLLGLPLFLLRGVERGFALLVPWLFVLVGPTLLALSLRAAGLGTAAASLAGLVALAPSTSIFLYSLRYGVYPFVIAALAAAAAVPWFAKAFLGESESRTAAVLVVLAMSFVLVWPLGALMLAPLPVFALFALPRWRRSEWLAAVAVVVALAAIHLPWVIALSHWGDSAKFAAGRQSPILLHGFSLSAAQVALRHVIEEIHPVALLLGLAGLALRGGPLDRRGLLAALVGWNLFLAVAGVQLKAEVALERFTLPFALFATIAAAQAFDRLLHRPASSVRTAIVAVVLATAGLSVFASARHYRSLGPYRYEVLPAPLARMLTAVREQCPEGRRVLVPGFSLHWFGGGHIAALPFLTGRAFLGNDFYHRRNYTDAVPRPYRSAAKLPEYLELYDVGCVFTWDEAWRQTAAQVPSLSLLREENAFALWRSSVPGSRFLRGHGTAQETPAGIVIATEDPDVVVRYHFVPGIRSVPPVEMEPYEVADGTSFIRLRPGGVRRIEIVH